MAKRSSEISGELVQYDEPNWEPLKLLGADGASEFMWMHEEELADGRRVHAYKHIDTRRYVHLDESGGALVYTDSGRYRAVAVMDVLPLVLPPPPPWDEVYDG